MKSLDYVQQPDGSFLWEMVEMDEAARKIEPAPAQVSDKPRSKRRTAAEETLSESASYEF